MKKFILFFALCLLLAFAATNAIAGATDTAGNPKICKYCGMDLTDAGRSRMLITYADGTTVEVCSLSCALADMNRNKDKQVKSMMVADYHTSKPIDAKTAYWVVGGKGVEGAFAGKDEAVKFAKDNGGEVTPFDQVMKAADEAPHSHSGHEGHMGPGAQMLFNPAFGDDIYHTHPKGMWMFNYKYMHMHMRGLRAGASNVSQGDIGDNRGKPYNYMMIPTSMSMDMHMMMVMYGITDRLTAMAMATYLDTKMDMLMDMGPGRMVTPEDPMRTHGFGDTELRGIYKINKYLVGSLGLSLPTGATNKTFVTMKKEFRAPYDMQLGSGTYDLKPALTYSALSDDAKWNWGAQAMYTYHINKNNGYKLGDSLKVTGWMQRAFGPVSSWLRLAFSNSGRINGSDPEIEKINHPTMGMGAPMPDADPANYGGQRLDALLGLSFHKGPVSIGIEGGIPIYQYLNGLQLKTTHLITVGAQIMF